MNCNTWKNITTSWIVKSRLGEGVGCLSAIYCETVIFTLIRGGDIFAEVATRGKVDGGTLFSTFDMVFCNFEGGRGRFVSTRRFYSRKVVG